LVGDFAGEEKYMESGRIAAANALLRPREAGD